MGEHHNGVYMSFFHDSLSTESSDLKSARCQIFGQLEIFAF